MENDKNIHQNIVDFVKKLNVEIINLSYDDFIYENYSKTNYLERNEVIIYNVEEINDFICYLELDDVREMFDDSNICTDAYGSFVFENHHILNNCDLVPTQFHNLKNGFADVLSFASINENGLVRFTQLVYSFKFKKIIVRDDVSYQIPFKVDYIEDFGGKRATYRYGNVLSIKTCNEVYEICGEEFKQSEKRKGDLSYPRLIIHC